MYMYIIIICNIYIIYILYILYIYYIYVLYILYIYYILYNMYIIKGPGMSSPVCTSGHIKDPVPLIEKRKGLSPGCLFPPSFIHQVIIITGLNKLCMLYVLALKKALDADWA